MITEDYVSFETAKLLKEKGFDGPCYKVWETHGDSQTLVAAPWFVEGETVVNRESVDAAAKQYAYEYNLNNNVEGYLAPTLQMAMRWLREKHNLHVEVRITNHGITIDIIKYYWVMTNTETGRWCDESTLYTAKAFDTPEEAEEDAIRHALEKLV